MASLFCPPRFTCRIVSTSKGKINYYEGNPDGKQTIVFLHGFGGGSSSFEWSKVYPAFSADFRVLAPDLPGWGFSEHLARDYTSFDYRRAIAEFLEQTCDQPIILVASSVVAGLSIWLATEKPHLFQSLILVCPTGLADFGNSFNGAPFQTITSLPVVSSLLYSQVIVSPLSIRLFLENMLFANKKRVTAEMVDAYYISGQQPRAEYAAFSFLKGYNSFDLAKYLPNLQTPTAILWGEKVNFASPDLGRRLAALSPQVKFFQIIADTGTVPHLESPAPAIASIVEALKTLALKT
jgi:pimeloyl-ACP methyl ester carboxylesterase